jgi:mannose-6-phosphate isomerase-like protein (cupin superfamily)
MMTVEPTQVRQNWADRGFSFGVFNDPPGQVWADFIHNTDEVVMLADGEIEVEMEGEKIYPSIGEEILIPARVRHTVANIGATPNRWYYGYQRTS